VLMACWRIHQWNALLTVVDRRVLRILLRFG
jgi:hypothetical protein